MQLRLTNKRGNAALTELRIIVRTALTLPTYCGLAGRLGGTRNRRVPITASRQRAICGQQL